MYMYVQIDGGMCICNIQMCTIVHVCVCECVHVNVQCIYMYYYNRTYLYIIHIYIWINTPGKMCHKQIYLWRMEANGVVLRSWMVAPWGFPQKGDFHCGKTIPLWMKSSRWASYDVLSSHWSHWNNWFQLDYFKFHPPQTWTGHHPWRQAAKCKIQLCQGDSRIQDEVGTQELGHWHKWWSLRKESTVVYMFLWI